MDTELFTAGAAHYADAGHRDRVRASHHDHRPEAEPIGSSVFTATWRRVLTWSAALYVIAWLVGLFIAPAGPGMAASAADVHAHFEAHRTAAVVQSVLVHGLAGLALAGVVLSVSRATGGTIGRFAGLAAVAVSLLQVALMGLLRQSGDADSALRWFDAINVADSFKLLALGIFVAATASALAHPRWVRSLTLVLAPLLPISGAAFLLRSEELYLVLYLSLPLLLIWTAAIAVIMRGRGSAQAAV